MQWYKAHFHWNLEQWRCVLWSGNPMDMSDFGGCQENGTCLIALRLV
ncbi:unnamed protein product [Staurois parvus]|uniref:Uncharacterized protein n=1 Tax=Staurois parvus TaxID=386267 RepID=A0ABN9HRC6_9NEOB|nr:unnamed protein product [Staurois parvus]